MDCTEDIFTVRFSRNFLSLKINPPPPPRKAKFLDILDVPNGGAKWVACAKTLLVEMLEVWAFVLVRKGHITDAFLCVIPNCASLTLNSHVEQNKGTKTLRALSEYFLLQNILAYFLPSLLLPTDAARIFYQERKVLINFWEQKVVDHLSTILDLLQWAYNFFTSEN